MIALNQLGNAILGGKPDESISSRLGNAREHGNKPAAFACHLLEAVDFHDKVKDGGDHCAVAVETHRERTKIAAEKAE
jgi:hypothetical protein